MPHRRLIAYAQLVRLPNVFTALADIFLGALASGALPNYLLPFFLLLLASTFLYWAGMIWNDYFDREQDQRERPFRPLPSGRISPPTALALGWLFMLAGLACAFLAGFLPGTWALALVAAIVLYDGWLKRTWAGPLAMGTCRFFNILLGLSLGLEKIPAWGFLLALVVGTYIIGVTWFARTEAGRSNKKMLLAAAAVMLASLLLSLALPDLADLADSKPRTSTLFPYLLVGFGFYVGIPATRAISIPSPARVQITVKRAVLGLILLDAILATALAGIGGLFLAALLPPALFLGHWLYST